MSGKASFVYKKVKTEYATPISGSLGSSKAKYTNWIKELGCGKAIVVRTFDGELKFHCKACKVRVSTNQKSSLKTHVKSQKHVENVQKSKDVVKKPKTKPPESTSSSKPKQEKAKTFATFSEYLSANLPSSSKQGIATNDDFSNMDVPSSCKTPTVDFYNMDLPSNSRFQQGSGTTIDFDSFKVDLIATMFSSGMAVEKLSHSQWEMFFAKHLYASATAGSTLKTLMETVCDQQLAQIGDCLRSLSFWAYIGEIWVGDGKFVTFIILGVVGTKQTYLLACKAIERKATVVYEELKYILHFYADSTESRLHQVYTDATPYREDLCTLIKLYYPSLPPVQQPTEMLVACKRKLDSMVSRIRHSQNILSGTTAYSDLHAEKILICEYKLSPNFS